MTKKYAVVRDRIVRPGEGFIEAFRMAIVEFSSLGERRFDLAGYPHASEQEALMGDWVEVGCDLRNAEGKLRLLAVEGSSRGRQSKTGTSIEGRSSKYKYG